MPAIPCGNLEHTWCSVAFLGPYDIFEFMSAIKKSETCLQWLEGCVCTEVGRVKAETNGATHISPSLHSSKAMELSVLSLLA